jgi:serine/threonine protein kinase
MFHSRTKFDHFEITGQIGSGGMSRVFSARDTSLERDVALKILNRACSRDRTRVQQFEKEAEITAQISHPNVVRVYTAGKDQEYFYIAMELVSGGSLEGYLKQHGKMHEKQALEMAIQAVQGLKAAKDTGLIHRDMKPGNILFAEDGTPKIVDFGLAIFARDSDGSGEIWATPYYVPPETLRHDPEDFRSDIYSLGATLYHALTGKPPCNKDTGSLDELKVLKSKPIRLKPAVHKLSAETCAVLERALAVKPADRYSSYDAFLDHLRYAQRNLLRAGSGKALPNRRSRLRRAWLWAGAAAVLAVSAAGVINFLNKPAPQPMGLFSRTQPDDPTAGSDSSTSARFLSARNAMMIGDFGKARQYFGELGGEVAIVQPTRNWSRFNAGLCALFMGDLADARTAFAGIAKDGLYSNSAEDSEMAHFFVDTCEALATDGLVPASRLAGLPSDSVRCIGLLAAGLKNWYTGDAAAAAELFKAFDRSQLPATMATAGWIEACKRLIRGYLSDAAAIAMLPSPDAGNMTAEEADATLTRARDLLSSLVQTGAPRNKAAAKVEALAASVAQRKEILAATGDGNHLQKVHEEFKLIREANTAAAALAESFRFAEAASKLKALATTTQEATAARDAHSTAWQKAEDFLGQLTRDLVRQPVESSMDHPGGAVSATVSASGTNLLFRPVQGVEAKIPINKIAPAKLVDLALLVRERELNSDEFYRRTELIFSFALRTGLTTAARAFGESLASEYREFRHQFALLNSMEFAGTASLFPPPERISPP